MHKHTLVCLIKDDKKASFKSVKASSSPSLEKIREVYWHNVQVLSYIVNFCKSNGIKSLRVSSSLFPLATWKPLREKIAPLLDEVGKEYAKINYDGVELSAHPDQFILLSSLNGNVNEASRYDLELYAHMSSYIPWNLINIHVGSKVQGFEHHSEIVKKEVSLLSQRAKVLLSFENDEKSYGFLETLAIAQENGVMMVPDFHHERCYQKRQLGCAGLSAQEHIELNAKIDQVIYDNLDKVIATYEGRAASPLFHISSPINGWQDSFKNNCMHADFIEPNDYPVKLPELSEKLGIDFRLDIEAKAKQEAIFRLENRS